MPSGMLLTIATITMVIVGVSIVDHIFSALAVSLTQGMF